LSLSRDAVSVFLLLLGIVHTSNQYVSFLFFCAFLEFYQRRTFDQVRPTKLPPGERNSGRKLLYILWLGLLIGAFCARPASGFFF
jgi:hypothetical protein